jgi:hypothetical protein
MWNDYYSILYICRRETGPLFIYVKRLWVSSFQGLALNMLRIGLWRPVLTTFWPIVGETPLWDPRHAFFPLFLLIWLPRHIYLGFSLHFYRGKFNNGYIYIYWIYIYIYTSPAGVTPGAIKPSFSGTRFSYFWRVYFWSLFYKEKVSSLTTFPSLATIVTFEAQNHTLRKQSKAHSRARINGKNAYENTLYI